MTDSLSPAPMEQRESDARNYVPKPMVIAAGLLMLCTIALAAFARFSGQGRLVRESATRVTERNILFQQLPDDVIRVLDADSKAVIVSFPAGEGGMIRGSLRAFAYTRKVRGVALDGQPFHLEGWSNGTLSLDDPVTGDRVELDAFGNENRAAFASLLRR